MSSENQRITEHQVGTDFKDLVVQPLSLPNNSVTQRCAAQKLPLKKGSFI